VILTGEQVGAFVAAVLLMELTPGPNMAYLFVVASRSGRAAGMVTVAGIALGLAVYLGLMLAGLTEAFRWP
jgi:threonine/homoserine/homoserine lactone efflux protein